MKSKRTISILLVIFTIALLLNGCGIKSSNSLNGIDIQAVAAKKQNIDAKLNISGVLVPIKTVNVFSKLSGQVERTNFEVGDIVKSGDTLATLETKTLNAQLEQVEASLQSAKATEQLAKAQAEQAKINLDAITKAYERTKELYNSGAVTKVELDDITNKYEIAKKQYETASTASLNQAKAAINAAQANIKNIKLQISNANIVSPTDGVVVNKNVNVGEIAAPTAPLFTIADVSTLKLKGTISQKYLPLINNGQEIDVYIDIYPNKTYKGQITNIGPMAVGTGMYFPIEISIKNTDNIKPGVSAHAGVNISSKEAIVVPASAVVNNDGQTYVYVIENNVAKKRIVEIGISNDKEVEIINGLNADEKVAISNVDNLFDNAVVNVK